MRARNFYRRKNHEHQGKSQDEAHNVRAPSGPCLPPRLDLTWLPATRSKTAAGSKWDEEVDGSFGVLDLKALLSESCDIATEHQRLVYKGRVLQDAQTLESSGARPLGCVALAPSAAASAQHLPPGLGQAWSTGGRSTWSEAPAPRLPRPRPLQLRPRRSRPCHRRPPPPRLLGCSRSLAWAAAACSRCSSR